MKVFPVDSIVTKLGEDGLPIYDRPYVSADLREVYANFFSNGVFMDDSTSLQVMNATGSMNVYVKAGTCHINGAFGVETEQDEQHAVERLIWNVGKAIQENTEKVGKHRSGR